MIKTVHYGIDISNTNSSSIKELLKNTPNFYVVENKITTMERCYLIFEAPTHVFTYSVYKVGEKNRASLLLNTSNEQEVLTFLRGVISATTV